MALTRSLRRRALLALLPTALLLSACDPAALTGGGGQAGKVTVALLLPQGDPDPQVSIIANSLQRAAALAVADSGSDLITLRNYATGGDANQAAAAAQQAINEGADVILGPFYSAAAAAAARVAAQNDTAVISFSNNTEIAGGNLYTFGFNFENTANQIGRYAARQGKKNIFIVNGRVPAEEIMREAALRGLAGSGAKVVGAGDFEFSQEGLNAALPGIAAAAATAGADALLLTSATDGALPVLSGQLAATGLGPASIQYLGMTRWNVPPSAMSLPGLQGGWFALPDPTGVAEFGARYAQANGANPHSLAVLAYDAMNAIVVQAGKSGASGLKPSSLPSAGTFAGAAGAFRFLSDRTVRRAMAIATIDNGSTRILQPASQRLGLGS